MVSSLTADHCTAPLVVVGGGGLSVENLLVVATVHMV